MTRIHLLAFLVAACGDPKPTPPWPPLLGKQSETKITRFVESCDERFAPVDKYAEKYGEPSRYARLSTRREGTIADQYDCQMSSGTHYSIDFLYGAVSYISIVASTEASRLEIFDRVFAASLPGDVRDVMRRSISDPSHFEFTRTKGGVIVEPSDNSIGWRMATKDEVLMRPAFERAPVEHGTSTAGESDDAH